jgi:hypothetical protein
MRDFSGRLSALLTSSVAAPAARASEGMTAAFD